jgi:hypothetical protein
VTANVAASSLLIVALLAHPERNPSFVRKKNHFKQPRSFAPVLLQTITK